MKRSLLGGAVVIAAGGLISKVIGAFYRVPLTNIIGVEGVGLYQMVFPVYCALLMLSSTGLPTALSRLIASGEDSVACLKKSLIVFGGIGLLGSVIMCVLGGNFAKLQGNSNARLCYFLLSPSVFFVSVISCFRGYFQGKSNMVPTATSQIVEQIVKTAVGLSLCYAFRHNVILAAGLASLAVSVSEIFGLCYLAGSFYFFNRGRQSEERGCSTVGLYGRMIKIVFPVAVAAMLLPLGHVADSFIVINNMSRYSGNATAVFGIYSGSVAAIIGLPVAVAYGVAVACVPTLSQRNSDEEIAKALRFTGVVAIASAVFIFFFARQCVELLYGAMSAEQIAIASAILTAEAFSVPVLSALQTTNAIALAKGKQKILVIASLFSLLIRIVLCLTLTSIPKVGIMGAVAAEVISLGVALFLSARAVLSKLIIARAVVDVGIILVWAIICVLGGFWLYSLRDGRLFFVFVALCVAVAYLLPVAIGAIKIKIKRQT